MGPKQYVLNKRFLGLLVSALSVVGLISGAFILIDRGDGAIKQPTMYAGGMTLVSALPAILFLVIGLLAPIQVMKHIRFAFLLWTAAGIGILIVMEMFWAENPICNFVLFGWPCAFTAVGLSVMCRRYLKLNLRNGTSQDIPDPL